MKARLYERYNTEVRAALKEKLPKYYKYLVELFGFDPDASTPVASTSSPPQAAAETASPGGT